VDGRKALLIAPPTFDVGGRGTIKGAEGSGRKRKEGVKDFTSFYC